MSIALTSLFHLNHNRMLRRTKRKRRPALGCQDVDTAAKVHAIFVRSPPGTLGDVHHAGQDARGDAGGDDQFAAIVPDADQVAIVDAPFSRHLWG